MTHGLDMTNDRANTAFVGALPWHGLGRQLTEGADLETWKKEAGLGWTIKTSPVLYTPEGSPSALTMPDRKLFYRSDSNAALAVVSNRFQEVQPGETIEFYRDLVSAAGFKLETAGSLFGGRKVWAMARCGEEVRIMGQDAIKPFLLLATACDGSMATCAHFTTVRVVCNNTLRMAIGSRGKKAQVRVPHHAKFDQDLVKAELGIVKESWENFISNVNLLAKTKIHRSAAIDIVAKELKSGCGVDDTATDDERLAESGALRNIIRLFDGDAKGAGYKSSNGTMWGLVNAVTEHYDHFSGAKSGDKSRAFERAQFTDNAAMKVRVVDVLLALAA